jgi:uncharacterized protein YyaL (SSP411 family)
MAHECFDDDEVAAVMNAGFVNVKVDREERPDVDALYMDAVQALTGRGGWPMTVFLTPTGEPFYGGTYFPKPQLLQLLAAITEVWTQRPEDVAQNVGALVDSAGRTARLEPAPAPPGLEQLDACLRGFAEAFDTEWGGFGSAPKFPSATGLDLLLRAHLDLHDAGTAEMVTTTLDAMASGGMYDHLAGGFARYSTDSRWLVPHFEKMLPDQALLTRAYLHGALEFDEPGWRQVVEETIDYVLRVLRLPGGGFASAEDADAPDEDGHPHEGRFTTWTSAEIRDALGDDADDLIAWYEVAEAEADGGHLDGRVVLSRLHHRGELVRPLRVESARRRLLAVRDRRPRPGLDDKVLTEWNAMAVATIAEAAAALDRDDWLAAAVAAAEFLLAELRGPDGRWHRSWHADGVPRARHAAMAGDHAALVDAFTRLAEATGEARWIREAVATAEVLLDRFWDPARGGLFTSADDAEQLVVRQKDLLDGAAPSANATAAVALVRLGALTGERRYTQLAEQILALLAPVMATSPTATTEALAAVHLLRNGVTEVVVVGDRPDLLAEVRRQWRPEVVLAWGEPYASPLWEGRPTGAGYVCRDSTCDLPATDVATLTAQLAGARLTNRPGG